MKSSLYNTFLKVTNNSTVIYNAYEDKTLICKGDINPENILCQAKRLLDKFEKEGFLIPDGKDEYQFYVNEAKKVEDNGTSFHLLINPTLNCNFRCWYCYESHIPSQMSDKTISSINKLIDRIYSEGRNLTISFFGGEPMLYYNQVMLPILKYAHSQSKKYGLEFNSNMTSNGYLLDEKKITELAQYDFTGAQITLDGDCATHNSVRFHKPGADTFTKIVDNIQLMAKANMNVTLRINCTHDNLKSITNIPKAFLNLDKDQKGRIRTDLHIVWQEGDHSELYEKMDAAVQIFNDNDMPTAKMEFSGFCYGDLRNSCVVNYNGDLYKCTAVDFHNTTRDGYLSEEGILVWENDSLEKRMASKFTNPICKTCRIMPLCHGGCTKQSLSSDNYCLHHQSDKEKDAVVVNRILYNSISNKARPL